MPSGGCTVTPGKILAPGEKINNAKLNQLGQPVVRIDEGAITDRELDVSAVQGVLGISGRNLFCNGDFQIWDDTTPVTTGIIPGGKDPGSKHMYVTTKRWLCANDANRAASIEYFAFGQTEVPGNPINFLRWTQAIPVVSTINPVFFGQRIEDVRRLAQMKVTFSIWIRSGSALTVTPQARQYFGSSSPPGLEGSAPVITTSPAVALLAGEWKQIVATFDMPSIAGKTLQRLQSMFSWTEFRIVIPNGTTFIVDFARGQLELGEVATPYEIRAPHQDIAFAGRYYEEAGMALSVNITNWRPFLKFVYIAPIGTPVLLPSSGTGATLQSAPAGGPLNYYEQATNHSIGGVFAKLINDAELYDDYVVP